MSIFFGADGAEAYMVHRSVPLECPIQRYRGCPRYGPLVASECREVEGALPTPQLRLLRRLASLVSKKGGNRFNSATLQPSIPATNLTLW